MATQNPLRQMTKTVRQGFVVGGIFMVIGECSGIYPRGGAEAEPPWALGLRPERSR